LKNPRFRFFAKKFIIKELSIIPVISDTMKVSGFHERIDGSPSSYFRYDESKWFP
jgi:hypothetical protein